MNKINIFKLKYLFLILFSLITGFSIGLYIENIYEKNTYYPYKWKKPPVLVNCYGDELLQSTAYRSISFWAIRGQSIKSYIHNPNNCKDLKNGYIVVKKDAKLIGSNTLAYAKKKKLFGAIVYSEIYIRPGSQNLNLLLEHEMGHSFGFGHKDELGHIMYPNYDMMGEKFNMP